MTMLFLWAVTQCGLVMLISTFRRNILSLSSGLTGSEIGDSMFLREVSIYLPSTRRHLKRFQNCA
jgi:hypothetical protein